MPSRWSGGLQNALTGQMYLDDVHVGVSVVFQLDGAAGLGRPFSHFGHTELKPMRQIDPRTVLGSGHRIGDWTGFSLEYAWN